MSEGVTRAVPEFLEPAVSDENPLPVAHLTCFTREIELCGVLLQPLGNGFRQPAAGGVLAGDQPRHGLTPALAWQPKLHDRVRVVLPGGGLDGRAVREQDDHPVGHPAHCAQQIQPGGDPCDTVVDRPPAGHHQPVEALFLT